MKQSNCRNSKMIIADIIAENHAQAIMEIHSAISLMTCGVVWKFVAVCINWGASAPKPPDHCTSLAPRFRSALLQYCN